MKKREILVLKSNDNFIVIISANFSHQLDGKLLQLG